MSAYSTQNSKTGWQKLTKAKVCPREAANKNPHTTVPAEHVQDMRWQHEVNLLSYAEVHRLYSQYTYTYVRAILQYMLRTKLERKEACQTIPE